MSVMRDYATAEDKSKPARYAEGTAFVTGTNNKLGTFVRKHAVKIAFIAGATAMSASPLLISGTKAVNDHVENSYRSNPVNYCATVKTDPREEWDCPQILADARESFKQRTAKELSPSMSEDLYNTLMQPVNDGQGSEKIEGPKPSIYFNGEPVDPVNKPPVLPSGKTRYASRTL